MPTLKPYVRKIHKRETWLFAHPFFNVMPKAVICTEKKKAGIMCPSNDLNAPLL